MSYNEVMSKFSIPFEVTRVTKALEEAGFEAYLVGGCVRDLIRGERPKDWDVTTNAKPEDITNLFEETFYNNEYGTVGVYDQNTPDESVRIVEVTPYRTETTYSNARHPDSVSFGESLEDDLKRRDFTMNAVAYSEKKGFVDPYGGEKDIARKVITTVGKPKDRFNEDALRILRAIRFTAELGFAIDSETASAIQESAQNLKKIAKERIRDELSKILMSEQPIQAFFLMKQLEMLEYVTPDLIRGIGIEQNQAHKYDVFEHLLRTMQHGADKGWSFDIRLAGLYHDISKPETRRWSKEKGNWTFYGHEVVGARVARRALNDLKFPKKKIDKIVTLVRWHMFFSDPEKITLSAVRRMVRNVGEENIWDLLNLRICDRIGSGRPKEQPFRFRKYKSMVEEALRDPISVTMLKIDGKYLIEELEEKAGPRIGWTLHALLEEVLDDSSKNDEKYLQNRAEELLKLDDQALKELGESGKKRQEAFEKEAIERIQEKHWVK
ncbi:MAG: HD domain-containing protein [Candidatus Paceibacterota bacterium]